LFDHRQLTRRYERLWRRFVPDPPPAQLEKQAIVFGLVPVLLRAVFRHWADELQKEWLTLAPTSAAEWVYEDGARTWIRARIAAVREGPAGGLWLVEPNVGVALDVNRFRDETLHNLRTLLALHVLREATGREPAGVIYQVINRPVRLWPRDSAQLSRFLSYSQALLTKSPEKYLHRIRVPIPSRKLSEGLQRLLAPVMAELRRWAGGEGHFPNVRGDPDDRYGYTRTEMYAAIVHGDFSDGYRRKSVFTPLMS
jgi:hypothetical protein